jgi:hypothetical protein
MVDDQAEDPPAAGAGLEDRRSQERQRVGATRAGDHDDVPGREVRE